MRSLGIAGLALLAACSTPAVCDVDDGPETLEVDASAFADDATADDVEVCIVIGAEYPMGRQEVCSPPGTATVGLSIASADYPKELGY